MPPKKTTTKKATTKKSVAKKTPAKKTVTKKSTADFGNATMAWAFAVLFLGAFVGTLIHSLSWSQNFDGETMFVANGKTWIPVEGEPMSLVILNDEDCGNACDTTASLQVLRQNISPALVAETVDVNSEDGQELIEAFQIKSVPQFIFGEELGELKADDGTLFIDNLPPGFFTEKDEEYLLNNTQVGFKVGKFIEAPVFADLDTEPKKGSGPITVVEFTDFQCPYCKRLHDQNKALIDQLIADNKITYIVKDFPLGFHKDAVDYAHGIANCTLKEGGQDAYWSMYKAIFDGVEQWSGKGTAGKNYLTRVASGLGVDVTSCLADASTKQEIDEDQAEGYLYGVAGTPALFIGGQVMPGAIGPDVFSAAVEAELGKQ